MTSAELYSSLDLDEARNLLVDELAGRVQESENEVRIRVHFSGRPDCVWFYAHRDNHWGKEPRIINDPSLAVAVSELLSMLASRGKSDEVSIRRTKKLDLIDTDIQFDTDWLNTHRGPHLHSYVMGILFRNQHASEHDIRRSSRSNFQKRD